MQTFLASFGSLHVLAQLQIGGPDLTVMVVGGLILLIVLGMLALAVIASLAWAMKRLGASRRVKDALWEAVHDPVRLMVGAGFIITVIFGFPSIIAVFYSGATAGEKESALIILKWLLGGWGFGTGASFASLLLPRVQKAEATTRPETASSTPPPA